MHEDHKYSRPLPELLDGDDWEVRNSGELKVARVDFKKKEFIVPFEYSSAGELVRAHEAMHVKISPRTHKYSEADFVTYQAVEDARVNQALRTVGIKTDNGEVYSPDEIHESFYHPSRFTPLRLGEAFFATKGLKEESAIRKVIEQKRPEVLPVCEKIWDKHFAPLEGKEIMSDEHAEVVVRELKKRLKEISTEAEKHLDKQGEINSGAKREKNLTDSWKPGDSDRTQEMDVPILTDAEMKEIKNALPRGTYDHSGYWGEGNPPGACHVEKAKFDRTIKFKKVRSVKTTPSDEGVIPQGMHRWATDQRIFTRKGRRRTSAAVLIDVSGSMSLSDKQIEEIIKLCPAAIVATYSAAGSKGAVRIVAENGRFSNVFKGPSMGGSNVVDFPALEWLAKQKQKKKIWVSDGQVTGIGDSYLDPYYVRKIVNLVRQYGIERVGNVKELIKKGQLIDRSFDDEKAVNEHMYAHVKIDRR